MIELEKVSVCSCFTEYQEQRVTVYMSSLATWHSVYELYEKRDNVYMSFLTTWYSVYELSDNVVQCI